MNAKPLVFPLLCLALAGAARADDFTSLYASPLPLPAAAAPADKHAVTYFLRGLVTVHPDRTVLNTGDGRVFILELSKEQAAEFDDRTVEIWGRAEASDDVDTLRVHSIQEYVPDPAAAEPPPHKDKFRPALFLGEQAGALRVDNLRWLEPTAAAHDFTWVSAAIRPELVKEIYFVTKVQPPGIAGHSLLFYEFEDGGFTDAAGRKSKGFFLSVEAYAREGQDYSLLAGFKKTYNIIWLLTNFEDYALDSTAFGKEWMNFYPLLTDKALKEKMTRDTVALATLNREGEWYHSTRNNCTNNLVMMINHGLPENKRVRMWTIPHLIYNFYATTPPMVPGYLGRKGVLGPKAFTITKQNYGEFLPPPAAPL
ncbi:MAG: hypothetical protein A2X35_03420 [Elusimicrobia bacterium GWA2_61_42]|nr:MAG: hypothetical protein A2X35_03420 [Elusimicrobia bacterium GWA2_61_42]OGR77635.1 MAG: hypothetical protein A2X38_09660 [Elusimicrobia bacterium GWC2_61_25]